MKLVRIGNMILNMEQLIAVQQNEQQLILVFLGLDKNNKLLSLTLEGESSLQMQIWLNRNGVNDLSAESPNWNW
ncbi:MAG: hypothetical protein HYS25_04220 [Ignavibacteriales bacterium]|nr:hypothetical protein [Ignavibacteriales bacterium]